MRRATGFGAALQNFCRAPFVVITEIAPDPLFATEDDFMDASSMKLIARKRLVPLDDDADDTGEDVC